MKKFVIILLYNLMNLLPVRGIYFKWRGLLIEKLLKSSGGNFRLHPRVNIYEPKNVSVGKNVVISYNAYLGKGDIILGNEVMVGTYNSIVAGNHTMKNSSYRYGDYDYGKITIGDGTWLGSHVVVTKNVNIGRGVMVAAGSVVTKDIPDFCIAAGSPAKVIKHLKKIMILGAGVYQVPLIKRANEMGLITVVVSPKGFQGIKYAAIHLDMDIRDTDRIVEQARFFEIGGIATTGADVGVKTIARVVEELKLIGIDYNTATICSDKTIMKDFFKKHDIPTAEYRVFSSDIYDAMMFAQKIDYPVMVKAVNSSGSRGITKVDSVNEFEKAWKRAKEISEKIIVEEYLYGIEFGGQFIISENKVIDSFIFDDEVTEAPYFTPIGHYMPSKLDVKAQVQDIAYKVQKALKIEACIMNVDFMLVGKKVYMIEIGARMGATCIPEHLSIYTGNNLYEFLINSAMRNPINYSYDYPKTPSACMLLKSDKTGIVESIDIPKLKGNDIQIQVDVNIGDRVERFVTGNHRIGHVIVSGVNCRSRIKGIVDQIKIKVK